jgi:hypothetical protein
MTVAQVSSQGGETHGMFGDRTLGQSFVPRPGNFGGGIQTGSSGNFLYSGRPDGSSAFATPWRRIGPDVLQLAVGAGPAAQQGPPVALSPQSPAPEYNLPELLTILGLAPASLPEATGWEGTSPAEQALGMTFGIGPLAAGNVAGPRVGARAGSASAARPQLYTRSAELSGLLTRIARTKGMLSGQGIDVYLGTNTTLLQGTVRTRGDSAALAGVLALEPEVGQIDNQLVPEASGTQSSNRKSR